MQKELKKWGLIIGNKLIDKLSKFNKPSQLNKNFRSLTWIKMDDSNQTLVKFNF
jgi:hypothetical protein